MFLPPRFSVPGFGTGGPILKKNGQKFCVRNLRVVAPCDRIRHWWLKLKYNAVVTESGVCFKSFVLVSVRLCTVTIVHYGHSAGPT